MMPRLWRFFNYRPLSTPQNHCVILGGYGYAAPKRGWFIPLKKKYVQQNQFLHIKNYGKNNFYQFINETY